MYKSVQLQNSFQNVRKSKQSRLCIRKNNLLFLAINSKRRNFYEVSPSEMWVHILIKTGRATSFLTMRSKITQERSNNFMLVFNSIEFYICYSVFQLLNSKTTAQFLNITTFISHVSSTRLHGYLLVVNAPSRLGIETHL